MVILILNIDIQIKKVKVTFIKLIGTRLVNRINYELPIGYFTEAQLEYTLIYTRTRYLNMNSEILTRVKLFECIFNGNTSFDDVFVDWPRFFLSYL